MTIACWYPESILQYHSSSAASPHVVDKSQTCKSCQSGLSWQEKEAREAAAATKKNWLLSEQTLDKQVVQGMDFTRNLESRQHLFLEVCCIPAVPVHFECQCHHQHLTSQACTEQIQTEATLAWNLKFRGSVYQQFCFRLMYCICHDVWSANTASFC